MSQEMFQDFLLGTSELPLSGPDEFSNFAGKRRWMKRIFMGQPMTKTVQGGKEFSTYAMFETTQRTHDYRPGAIETPTHANVMSRGVGYWRRSRTYDTYVEDEYELNDGGDQFEAWFHVRKVHAATVGTDLANFFEGILTRVPNKLEMEDSNGSQAMSLLAINNEFQYGLPSSAHPGGAWTTVHGFDPVAKPGWRPQRQGYGGDAPSTGANFSLFKAFDVMERITQFDQAPDKEAFITASSGTYVIMTDGPGIDLYRTAIRNCNDHLRYSDGHNPKVPYTKFGGYDIVESSDLRNAEVYPTGSSGALSNAWDTTNSNAGSRYHWWNTNSLALIRHNSAWMRHSKPMTDVRQPDTVVMYVTSKYNFFCEERRANGTVYPTSNVTWTPAAA